MVRRLEIHTTEVGTPQGLPSVADATAKIGRVKARIRRRVGGNGRNYPLHGSRDTATTVFRVSRRRFIVTALAGGRVGIVGDRMLPQKREMPWNLDQALAL
jgi:hypothetical protein